MLRSSPGARRSRRSCPCLSSETTHRGGRVVGTVRRGRQPLIGYRPGAIAAICARRGRPGGGATRRRRSAGVAGGRGRVRRWTTLRRRGAPRRWRCHQGCGSFGLGGWSRAAGFLGSPEGGQRALWPERRRRTTAVTIQGLPRISPVASKASAASGVGVAQRTIASRAVPIPAMAISLPEGSWPWHEEGWSASGVGHGPQTSSSARECTPGGEQAAAGSAPKAAAVSGKRSSSLPKSGSVRPDGGVPGRRPSPRRDRSAAGAGRGPGPVPRATRTRLAR